MTKEELYKSLHVGLFSERDTINIAYDYANDVAQSTDNPAAVMTAIQVVVNTIANELLKLED